MKYISTRGLVDPVNFEDVVVAGQAADGGLYLPEHIPDVRERLAAWRELTFIELAFEIVRLYATDTDPELLRAILEDAYATFAHPEVVPLVERGGLMVLELFHGPTLAFKDIALQVLGRLFETLMKRRNDRMNILGATSGDTGSAAISGVRGRDNLAIFVMFPHGRVSRLQELQMTTVCDSNVHCLAIDGSFDDCQAILKTIFGDLEFKKQARLGAVNSINWARLMVQIVYYAFAALRFDKPISFAVPTGNFGNILSGILAMRMGVPIDRLILGTNENDILARFFKTGRYERREVQSTINPSMDIQVASNLERFLYLHLQTDAAAVRTFMQAFNTAGKAELKVGGNVDGRILGVRVDAATTMATIRSTWDQCNYLIDPHTAVGVAAAKTSTLDSEVVCLATAHPAKFPEAVNTAAGQALARHPLLERLKDKEARKVVLRANEQDVRDYIATNVA